MANVLEVEVTKDVPEVKQEKAPEVVYRFDEIKTVEGGAIVHLETGELLGTLDTHYVKKLGDGLVVRETFVLKDMNDVDKVMGWMQRIDASNAGLNKWILSLIKNQLIEIRANERKKAWLVLRYGDRIREIARENDITATRKLNHGVITVKKSNPTWEVFDSGEALAIEFAEKNDIEIKKEITKTPVNTFFKLLGLKHVNDKGEVKPAGLADILAKMAEVRDTDDLKGTGINKYYKYLEAAGVKDPDKLEAAFDHKPGGTEYVLDTQIPDVETSKVVAKLLKMDLSELEETLVPVEKEYFNGRK